MVAQNSIIDIDLNTQQLAFRRADEEEFRCPVSTAKNGAGEKNDSFCTPRGRHEIHAKFGADCAANTVFVGRQCTGEVYTPELGRLNPGRDWILTRILWLSGLEEGKNSGGDVDTLKRYIYLHGCPDDVDFDRPGSHGCVRLRNDDITVLFDLVELRTQVMIHE